MTSLHATFYTVSNARYFPGTVALLNSLRLTGNHYPLVVLDSGLSSRQRELLRPHCAIAALPAEVSANPVLSKPFPYRLRPSGTVVIIDSDIIVTRSLHDVLKRATAGEICVVADPDDLRWSGEWRELFGVSGELRAQTYVNSGFVAFSATRWPGLLALWWQACHRVPPDRVVAGRPVGSGAEAASEGSPRRGEADPVAQGDQDALNALLMSEFPAEARWILPPGSEVFHAGLRRARVVDARTLACTYMGHPTALLHFNGSPKPWERAAWAVVQRDAYVRLLRRLLVAKDVPLGLPGDELPVWLAKGLRGRLAMHTLDLAHVVFSTALDRMPPSQSARLRRAFHQLTARVSTG